ncbi:MAG TPA: acyl carrier protein [Bacteroidota bacterium]|nr:acyl carrier protein [Bacteroidota bacterium]
MTQEEIRTKVHQFIRKNFLFDDKAQLGDDQSLLGSGVVDSTGILELISFLEETCRVKFEDSDLVADNFDTINKIAAFITTKLPPEKS